MNSTIYWLSGVFVTFTALPTFAQPTVTFTLDQSVPGVFKVFAAASQGDNFGIVGYGIPLVGSFTSLDHKSPQTLFGLGPSNQNGPAGFPVFRSADGSGDISAIQQIFNPTPLLIRGFGQEPNSFIALGINAIAFSEQTEWSAPLLIAEGTCPGICDLAFNPASIDSFADVFLSAGGTTTIAARRNYVVLRVPEPTGAGLAIFAAMGASCVSRRRQRRG